MYQDVTWHSPVIHSHFFFQSMLQSELAALAEQCPRNISVGFSQFFLCNRTGNFYKCLLPHRMPLKREIKCRVFSTKARFSNIWYNQFQINLNMMEKRVRKKSVLTFCTRVENTSVNCWSEGMI